MTGILVAVMAAITLASVAGTGLAQAQTNALTDRAALVARYNATDGPNWANRADWLSGQPIGDWYGIVTDDSGRTYTLQRARTHTLQRAPTPTRSSGVMDVSAGGFGLSRSMLGRHLAVNPLPAAWLNSRSRRKTAGKPLENRWKTAGRPLAKLSGKPPGKLPAKAPFLGDFCQSQ